MPKLKMPNGEGSITKLTGRRRKPWLVRKTIGFIDKKQRMIVIGTYATYKEAMQALLEHNKNPKAFEAKKYTFENVYDGFCDAKYTSKGKDIPYRYIYTVKRFEKLLAISFADFKLFDYEEILKKETSPTVKRDIKTLLNQMYIYAIKHEITDRNVAQYIETEPIPESSMHQDYNEDEMKLLWKVAPIENFAKISLIYCYTGLRPSELLNIKSADVHLSEKYMIGGMKNDFSKNRIIPLAECILPFIKHFYNPANEYLINLENHKSPVTNQTIRPMRVSFNEKYGINHQLHDGRHTFATMADKAGANLIVTQLIMGHKPKELVSKTYIHKHLDDFLKVVNMLPKYNV